MILLFILLASNTIIAPKTTPNDITITKTIKLSTPIFSTTNITETNYTRIDLAEGIITGMPGDPSLPSHIIHILLPSSKHQISSITLTPQKKIDYSFWIKERPILPIQENKRYDESWNTDTADLNTYHYGSKIYPKQTYTLGETHHLKGYPIKTIQINPFIYDPQEETLIFYETIMLTITFKENIKEKHQPYYRGNSVDENQIRSLVDNPEQIISYPLDQNSLDRQKTLGDVGFEGSYPTGLCDSSETVEYVIVTSNDLVDTNGYEYNWTDLLDHRQTLDGFSGRIITIEDIDDCTDYWNATAHFNDSAAHLREFCKDAYLDWNTQYVLLGGDWDISDPTRQKIPARLFTDIEETADMKTMPSDLYYSNLDGDWYDENNAVWGGGRGRENDKYAELSIGRIPVATGQEVSNSVKKIIWYDTTMDADFLNNSCFYGGDLGWTSTSKEYMEELRLGTGAYEINRGFEEWNDLYPEYPIDTDHRFYHEDTGGTIQDLLILAINNNELSIINHLDHGDMENTLSLGYGQMLTNNDYFLGVSQACLSGRYTDGRSGAESFISETEDAGAYAMILNTGYGYGNDQTTYGASQQHDTIFWDYFFTNQSTEFSGWRLGDGLRYAKDKFSDVIDTTSHAFCYVWYSWNLFGDPAQNLRIQTESEPLNHPPTIESPFITNASMNVDTSVNFTIRISDADDDLLNWSINCSNGQNRSDILDGTGIKYLQITDLSYNTNYTIWVNVTDGNHTIKQTIQFHTRETFLPTAPNEINGTSLNTSTIHLSWEKGINADRTIIERNIIPSWDFGTGIEIYNDTGKISYDQDLRPHTTYYYQFISWNQTDNTHNISRISLEIDTLNSPPQISHEQPINNSQIMDTEIEWSVLFTDADDDPLNWTITCSNGQINHSDNDAPGRKQIHLTDLMSNTTYMIIVNLSDGYDTLTHSYDFTTLEIDEPPFIHTVNITPINKTSIKLEWAGSSGNHTIIDYNTSPSWDFGKGIEQYTVNETIFNHTGLSENTTYYYQICYYNLTFDTYSDIILVSATTRSNTRPEISVPVPLNNSIISTLSVIWKITIEDDDYIGWSINCSNGQNISETGDEPGTKTLQLTDLSYDTTYTIMVSATDSKFIIHRSYQFTTSSKPTSPSSPPPSGPAMLSINDPPKAIITGPTTASVNETIRFSGILSNDTDGEIQGYRWDIDNDSHWDAPWENQPFFNYSYDQKGTYTVVLQVTDGQDITTDTMNITIQPANMAPNNISIILPTKVYINEPVLIHLSAYDADDDDIRFHIKYDTTLNWSWTPYIENNQLLSLYHIWDEPGRYDLMINAEDEHALNATQIKIIEIQVMDTGQQSTFNTSKTTHIHMVNQSLFFPGFSEDQQAEKNFTYLWWCSDGYTSNSSTLTHSFQQPGKYIVVCHRYDPDGTVSTLQQTVYVSMYSSANNKQMLPSISLLYIVIIFLMIVSIGIIIHFGKSLYHKYKNKVKWSNIRPKKEHTLPDIFSTPDLLRNDTKTSHNKRSIKDMSTMVSSQVPKMKSIEDFFRALETSDQGNTGKIDKQQDIKKHISHADSSFEDDES